LITERLEKITRAQAVTEDLAHHPTSVLSLQRLVNQLLTLQTSIAAFDKAIQALFAQHPDHLISRACLGLAPNWLPDCWRPLLQSCCAESPQRNAEKSGTAPVLDRSGQGKTICRRWCRSKFPLPDFHEFAVIPSRTPPGPRLVIKNSLLE